MKRFITAVLVLAISACGKGPNDAQLGNIDLSANKLVTFSGVAFEASTTAAANQKVTIVRLGEKDEKSCAEAAGDYNPKFQNSELKITEIYKANGKVCFTTNVDGLSGLMKIESATDTTDAGTKAFSCRLSRNTLGSEQPILERGSMLAKQALYVSSDGGKDLAVTTPTNVTMKLACEPGVTSDVIDVDHRVLFANELVGNCKVGTTRIGTYSTDKDGNQILSWKINSTCDVIAVGDDVNFIGTTPPIDCKALGNCPPPTCQELGNCQTFKMVCADPEVCYSDRNLVTITPYSGDANTTLSFTHEVNGTETSVASSVITGRVGQGLNYTRTGAPGTHYSEQYIETLGTLTAGSQQSFSRCWYSSNAQTFKLEVGQRSMQYQFANMGVWLEIHHPGGKSICRTFTYNVSADPVKVPSSVTSYSNVGISYYVGETTNHTGWIDN